jgi:hypothetical protein
MVQPFPVVGSWWLQPTLTATANRITYFSIRAADRDIVYVSGAYGPTVPAGWSFVAP